MEQINEKLKTGLKEAISLDMEKLLEGTESDELHVFSKTFNKKMKVLFQKYKCHTSFNKVRRHAVAVVLVLFIFGGYIFISAGAHTANASHPGVDILIWLKDYFSFEKGSDAQNNSGINFKESQLTYIPEGFEKTGEIISNTAVKYEYADADNVYFILRVDRDKSMVQSNSNNLLMNASLNAAGYEYTYFYNEVNNSHQLVWLDADGLSYSLFGTTNKETLIKIMDNITYER